MCTHTRSGVSYELTRGTRGHAFEDVCILVIMNRCATGLSPSVCVCGAVTLVHLCEPGADMDIPEFTCLCTHMRLHLGKLAHVVCVPTQNMHTHICEHLQVRAHTEDSVT